MLSFFRRKKNPDVPSPDTPHDSTFQERVVAFWRWFEAMAPTFYAAIESKQSGSLPEDTSKGVDAMRCGFAWVYGPGANDQGHSLTLSAEGIIHGQLLLQHWLAEAPTLPGWTFYAARQPGPIKGRVIETNGRRYEPEKIWVTPKIDSDRQRFDLTVWHPLWDSIDEKQRGFVTFLYLDECLGEYGTERWVGIVDYGKEQLAGSFPLHELPGFIAETTAARGWKLIAPGEATTLYRTKEKIGDFPRGDIISQATVVPRLFRDYMDSEGELPDPLKNTGAEYAYVSIDVSYFPPKGEVAKRAEVEDMLDQALRATRGGRLIGGAFGPDRGYVDLLLLDGKRSLNTVKQSLARLKLPLGTMIEYFAREKRGHRIAL